VPSDGPSPTVEPTGGSVVDLVVRLPKTLGPDASVAEVRAALTDDHVHMVLLTEDGRLVGTLVRDDLPDRGSVAEDSAALPHAELEGRTVSPRVSAGEAMALLAGGGRRLAVVDDAGRLLGLLCLKRRRTGFCSDEDVAARARERAEAAQTGTVSPSRARANSQNAE